MHVVALTHHLDLYVGLRIVLQMAGIFSESYFRYFLAPSL